MAPWVYDGTTSEPSPQAQRAEIERLRGWLAYIEGRFAPADESAAAALRGEPVPQEFASWRGIPSAKQHIIGRNEEA